MEVSNLLQKNSNSSQYAFNIFNLVLPLKNRSERPASSTVLTATVFDLSQKFYFSPNFPPRNRKIHSFWIYETFTFR